MSRSTSPQRTRAAEGSAIAMTMRVPETNVPFLFPFVLEQKRVASDVQPEMNA